MDRNDAASTDMGEDGRELSKHSSLQDDGDLEKHGDSGGDHGAVAANAAAATATSPPLTSNLPALRFGDDVEANLTGDAAPVSVAAAANRRLRRERTLERTLSVSSQVAAAAAGAVGAGASVVPPVEPGPRVVGEFKTLSISLSQGGLAADPATSSRRRRAHAATRGGVRGFAERAGRSALGVLRGDAFAGKGAKEHQAKALNDLSEIDWHHITPDEALRRLGSSASTGLDSEQVHRRQQQLGANRISKPPRRLARKLFGYVFGGFGSLLLGASVLCFISWKPLGEPSPQVSNLALAVVLLVVVVVNTVFNAWQDWTTSRTMAAIGGMLPEDVVVVRDGSRHTVAASQLTRGDVVVLSMGMKAAADMRVISVESELKFERSALTGESDAVPCTLEPAEPSTIYLEARNVVLAGTSCVAGSGLGVVVSIGDSTVFGRLAKLSSAPRTTPTTLEVEIRFFVLTIAAIATAIVIIALILWLAFLRPKHPGFMSGSALVVNLVSIMVAFIPEGLPPSITISLTAVAARMKRARCLAKNLAVVETLGAVNVVCSDKTGTLTTNCMRARRVGVLGEEATPAEALREVTLQARPVGSCFQQLQFVGAVCNDAVFEDEGKLSAVDVALEERRLIGQPTDTAVLRLAEELSPTQPIRQSWRAVAALAFNSRLKFASTLLEPTEAADVAHALGAAGARRFDAASQLVLLTKGAPDVLVPHCTHVLDAATGDVVELTQERRDALAAMQLSWATQGQRVLLLARRVVLRKDLETDKRRIDSLAEEDWVSLESHLTVVGMVGIVDPPRAEIPSVVATVRGAGSRFFMVTGDHSATAVAIARQCGIVTAEKVLSFADLDGVEMPPEYDFLADNDARAQRAVSITGDDIRRMTDVHWEKVCRFDEIVFSRVVPEQKVRVVQAFQERRGVVAMTGDGVNDAPALKKADVGVAMGSGSAVAIESADLVLLDTFSSIVDALLYGRLCFENLRKTIAYLLPAGCFAELWAVLVAFFFGLPQPLSNVQMILVCVTTDLVSALSLIYEKPEADLLTRKPRDTKRDRLADWKLLFHAYILVGVPTAVTCQAMAFWYLQRNGVPFSDMWLKYGGGRFQTENPERFAELLAVAQGCFFACQIFMQLGNLLSIRTRRLSILQQPFLGRAATRNVWILPAAVAAVCFFFFFSYVPGLHTVLQASPVPVENIFLPVAFGLGMLLLDETRKLWVRTHPRGWLARIAW